MEVTVPACGCRGTASWCGQEVALPHLDWNAIFGGAGAALPSLPPSLHRTDWSAGGGSCAAQPPVPSACEHAEWAADGRSAALVHCLGPGSAVLANSQGPGGCSRFRLRGEFDVLVVDDAAQLPDALAALRASMRDPLVAIDLEWRPDQTPTSFNRVALLQLATARLAVLVRTCRMRFQLAPCLASFLRDPSVVLVGFAWKGGDEHKMTGTFGFGRSDFGCFVDLQEVAAALGYHNYGLSALAQRVLGAQMPKASSVSMSNWEAAQGLTAEQISYGALDALVAGQVLRGLRLWHSSPSPCAACRQPLGSPPECPALRCAAAGCQKRFKSINAMIAHGRSLGHRTPVTLCHACGRHT